MVNTLSSSVETLQGTVDGLSASKADKAAVDTLSASVETLEGTVDGLSASKADKAAVDTLSASVDGVGRDRRRPFFFQGRQGRGGHPVRVRGNVERLRPRTRPHCFPARVRGGRWCLNHFATSLTGALNLLHETLQSGESVSSLTIQVNDLKEKVGSTVLPNDLTTSVAGVYDELSLLNTSVTSKAEQSSLGALETTGNKPTKTVGTKATNRTSCSGRQGRRRPGRCRLQTDLAALKKR